MKRDSSKMMWRWWSGGTVIALAAIIGCATAVDFRNSDSRSDKAVGHSHGTKTSVFSRNVANDEGEKHNGGKVMMPVSVSFDGDQELTITRETNVILTILPESDIVRLQGNISGENGLESFEYIQLNEGDLPSGQPHRIEVRIPPKTGSLIVRLVGDVAGQTMTRVFDLKVTNPADKTVKSASKPAAADVMPPEKDATGQVVQPMKSSN